MFELFASFLQGLQIVHYNVVSCISKESFHQTIKNWQIRVQMALVLGYQKTLQAKANLLCESPNACLLRYLSEMVMLAGAAWIRKNQPREITGRPWKALWVGRWLESMRKMTQGLKTEASILNWSIIWRVSPPIHWGVTPRFGPNYSTSDSGSRNASVFCKDLVREVPGARSMSRRDIRPLDRCKSKDMAFLFFLTKMCLTSSVSIFRLLAVDAV